MKVPLIKEFNYNVPIEKVWEALTDKDKMKQWYFSQLLEFEPIVGFKFQFDDNSAEYQKEWIVTKIVEGKTLAHSWAYKGYPGSSEVTFELSEEGDRTRLKLTHTGLASFPRDPHFARQRFEDGWNQIIKTNLKKHLEKKLYYTKSQTNQ